MEHVEIDNLVIGSGPSGVAAAVGLLSRGARVTMVDVGHDLDPERQAIVHRSREALESGHVPAELEQIKRSALSQDTALPLKLAFGSDYPYSGATEVLAGGSAPSGTALLASHAKGGLSTVWGANFLRYRNSDISAWPITASDLEPHYDAVEGLMATSSVEDGLGSALPRAPQVQRRDFARHTGGWDSPATGAAARKAAP